MNLFTIKKMLRLSQFSFYALIALMIFGSCAEKEKQEIIEPEQFCLSDYMQENIKIDTVARAPITESILLNAKVAANPDKVVHFVSLVSGVVTRTNFSLGEEVRKGQVLMEIRSAELSGLTSQKASLQSQILVAQRDLEAVQEMHDDKIASHKDLIEAQSNLDILVSELNNTKAQLDLYSAGNEQGVFQIKAASSGIIINKNIASGMQISAEGDPLFTIADIKEVWIVANIYAGNVPYIKKAMKVDIKASAYPDEVFTGEINTISQVFDAEERVLKARIIMDNTTGHLMPGMLVDVVVEKQEDRMANSVPINALIFDDNQHFLLRYTSECDVEILKVSPVVQNEKHVFFENNIEEGDKIISKNHLLIYNHLKALK